MNSRDYWAMRSAQDMVDRMGTAEQTAAEMNRAIQQSADYITKEVKAVFRGMESFGISETEARKILNAAGNKTALQNLRAAAGRVSDPEKRQAIISAIDSAGAYRYRITRLEQLNKDINAECRKLYKTENRAVTSALKTVANDSYYHSMFNIQQAAGLGFSFAKFSQKDVDRILRGNWNGGNYSQRIWKDVSATAESMKKELLVSMLTGRSNEKTARIIGERFGVNAYCARRIVRTESAYVANAAQMSAYNEAGVEKYRFIATLDSKTSEVCAALDGKVFAAKDAVPGTNYPPMHPFCRSTTIADFGEDTLAGMERRARDKDGNVVRVPADMSYEEWYRRFVENGVDKSAESGIISVGNAMAEIQNRPINSEIAFAKKIRVDPEGVERARTFIQNELGIANPDLRNLKNAEVAQPFLEEIGAMQEKYGKVFSHIEFYNSAPDDRTLAETLNGTLRLNSRFFNDSSATQQLLDYWENKLHILPKGDNNISYIARHEYGHLLTQYQIKANSRLTIIISRSISKGTKLISDNPLQYYNEKKYTEKFYHEVCADSLGASKLDAKQLVLKNKILEVIL